jgi:hypothetical protein
MSDPNEGSVVLFRRGIRPDGSAFGDWEVGYVKQTYFVDESGRVCEPTLERSADLASWLLVAPAAPDGRAAPTTVPVPLDFEHVDPIVHGTELPSGRGGEGGDA